MLALPERRCWLLPHGPENSTVSPRNCASKERAVVEKVRVGREAGGDHKGGRREGVDGDGEVGPGEDGRLGDGQGQRDEVVR